MRASWAAPVAGDASIHGPLSVVLGAASVLEAVGRQHAAKTSVGGVTIGFWRWRAKRPTMIPDAASGSERALAAPPRA